MNNLFDLMVERLTQKRKKLTPTQEMQTYIRLYCINEGIEQRQFAEEILDINPVNLSIFMNKKVLTDKVLHKMHGSIANHVIDI